MLLWPLLVFVCLRLLLRDRFPPNFQFVGDGYRDAAFFIAFSFGFFVAHDRSLWAGIRRCGWPAFGLRQGSLAVLAPLLAARWLRPLFGLRHDPTTTPAADARQSERA